MSAYIFSIPIFLVLYQCLQTTSGHSWLACTDYAEKNAAYYDHDLCRGYARSSINLATRGGTFGSDTGFDFHPSEGQPCKTTRNDNTEYDSQHPISVYYVGQQVVLAHPMKNHGSDTCTNAFIPDNGNFIYRGGRNDQSDLTLSGFKANLVADLGVKDSDADFTQYPKPGYQNAPAFCADTDKSLGTYSFNVPSDLEPGRYTFVWLWAFNSAEDLYSSCFEVDIVGTLAERNSMLLSNGFTNFYEPCGGLTSDFNIPGNTNPGCVDGDTSSSVAVTSASTTSTTLTSTTMTTTTTSTGETLLNVLTLQMGGEISLPQLLPGTARRYISLHWECAVIVNFWNVRVTGQHDLSDGSVTGVHYDLLQEGSEMESGKFYYHAMFKEPCDLTAYPPIAKHIRDEL